MGKIKDQLINSFEFAQKDKVDQPGNAARSAAQELAAYWDGLLSQTKPLDPETVKANILVVQEKLQAWSQAVLAALEDKSQCNTCEKTWPSFQVERLSSDALYQRVQPGDIMPTGGCPDAACKGLCYLVKQPDI